MITLNHKLCFAVVLTALAFGCSKGEFSASGKSSGSSSEPSEADQSAEEADEASADEPTDAVDTSAVSGEDALSQCALALGGAATDVIRITGGATDVALTPGSIVLLETGGNASVNLPATEVASIKGICIDAGGGSKVDIHTELNVAGMYVYGQGNPDLTLDFGEKGLLSKVLTDLGGSPTLIVSGTLIDCAKLDYQKQGSAELSCNGVAL
jgi:hypothetical protein